MSKAIFHGTCQWCGADHKLPSGMLAKHGYTTRLGFFEGVCPGSRNLPFEQSKDMIDEAIANALARGDRMGADLRAIQRTTTKFVVSEVKATSVRGLRIELWRSLERAKDFEVESDVRDGQSENTIRRFSVVWLPGAPLQEISRKRSYFHGYFERERALFAQVNADYCWHMKQMIGQVAEYVAWQRKRIENWAPTDLTPVDAKAGA